MKTRYGCLTLLLLVAAVVAPTVWFAEDPGKSSAIAVGGFFGLVVIYVGSGLEWLTTRGKAAPSKPKSPPAQHTGDG